MYVNAKMIPVETVPGIWGGGCMRERSGGGNSSMMYWMHFKCYNVPTLSKTIKKNFKKNEGQEGKTGPV
jgi:hypothetical protein